MPVIFSRIEDSHLFCRQWIGNLHSVRAKLVAAMATQPEILAIIRPTERPWQQMLDFQTIRHHLLWAAAISTLETRVLRNQLIEEIRDTFGCQ